MLISVFQAGLHNAQNIESVRIGDISTAADIDRKRMITLAEVTIDIDIFDLNEGDEAEVLGRLASSHGIFGTEENHGTPQAKITSLPNKSLNGVWDS